MEAGYQGGPLCEEADAAGRWCLGGGWQAAFKKAGAQYKGSVKVDWKTENQMVWQGTPEVPFAARGINIQDGSRQ